MHLGWGVSIHLTGLLDWTTGLTQNIAYLASVLHWKWLEKAFYAILGESSSPVQ